MRPLPWRGIAANHTDPDVCAQLGHCALLEEESSRELQRIIMRRPGVGAETEWAAYVHHGKFRKTWPKLPAPGEGFSTTPAPSK